MKKSIALNQLFFIFLFGTLLTQVSAGLDEFTSLDEIDDWIIERRIDSKTNEIVCRGSIIGYGTWFSARIRLDQNDQLIIPSDLSRSTAPKRSSIEKVKEALRICRSGLIYLPFSK